MPNSLNSIEPYVQHLEDLVIKFHLRNFNADQMDDIEAALNGELSKTLRDYVPLRTLREHGAFFTADIMANRLISFLDENNIQGTALDAACGGGNLLLAYARKMPIAPTWYQTLNDWGKKLKAYDIHEPLVRATKARLALYAAQRGIKEYGYNFVQGRKPLLEDIFPYINTQDSLSIAWPKVETVILNPPFNSVAVPEYYSWTTGKISYAALFILKFVEEAQDGAVLRAILPDVLRSGSRYRNWRLKIEQMTSVLDIEILGRFDEKTDVDVFILTLKKKKQGSSLNGVWWQFITSNSSLPPNKNEKTVGDLFSVNVGRVVPHRDAEIGPEYPYLDASQVPAWKQIEPGNVKRRFEKTTFCTPFVIIRRNSRANDKHRAVGTIVHSAAREKTQVAVENHLIVVRPNSGTLTDCKKLIKVLQNPQSTDWLNSRIRCRHLTAGAIKELPYKPD